MIPEQSLETLNMPVSLKVTCKSEIRRVLLGKDNIKDFNYATVCDLIQQLFPEESGYTTKYADDEGDLCTLCEASFSDFVKTAAAKAGCQQVELLKLQLCSSALSQPLAASGGCALVYQQVSAGAIVQARVGSGCSDMADKGWEGGIQQSIVSNAGHRLGGTRATIEGSDELRTKAFLAAEERRAALPGITKEKAAELLGYQARQDLLGRITELYHRLSEDMPMGINAAPLEKLQRHADRLRARLNARVAQPPGRNSREELLAGLMLT